MLFLGRFIGKSTQLPAYLLENDPEGAKIVVAQPRRLAATGVASRVAEERGESRPGVESVGYVVRGDSAMCDRTRLMFCTTGVLLRQLQNEGALECVTHSKLSISYLLLSYSILYLAGTYNTMVTTFSFCFPSQSLLMRYTNGSWTRMSCSAFCDKVFRVTLTFV